MPDPNEQCLICGYEREADEPAPCSRCIYDPEELAEIDRRHQERLRKPHPLLAWGPDCNVPSPPAEGRRTVVTRNVVASDDELPTGGITEVPDPPAEPSTPEEKLEEGMTRAITTYREGAASYPDGDPRSKILDGIADQLETFRAWYLIERDERPATDPPAERCPKCKSPDPEYALTDAGRLIPAVCGHPWHHRTDCRCPGCTKHVPLTELPNEIFDRGTDTKENSE